MGDDERPTPPILPLKNERRGRFYGAADSAKTHPQGSTYFYTQSKAHPLDQSWKARVMGYEELKRIWESADPNDDVQAFQQLVSGDLMKRMVTDANLVAYETALGALLAFATNAPTALVAKYLSFPGRTFDFPQRCRTAILTSMVEKAFASSRTATRNKAPELILAVIDADVPGPVVVRTTLRNVSTPIYRIKYLPDVVPSSPKLSSRALGCCVKLSRTRSARQFMF
jgi:hypothetical protein